VVHDPGLGVRAGSHRDGIEADGDRPDVIESIPRDREDLEPVVGGVDRQQRRAVGGEVDRADVRRLPVDEGVARGREAGGQADGDRDEGRS
jgi:hypothetical protein